MTYVLHHLVAEECRDLRRPLGPTRGDTDLAPGNDGAEENVSIGFSAFGDSALNIIFIYYIKKAADILGTQTEMNMKILEEFTRARLDFAFPTQTVYTKQLA